MDNLEIYNFFRKVPDEAKKTIVAGRLKGKTDINPMWRIKVLTDKFGACGLGWYYEITKQWIEEGCDSQKVAFTNINLFVKIEGEWSKAIPGTGGSSFISKERAGLYTSDECFKMSLTDAISISCKALGIAADVYFEKDRTKYDICNVNNHKSLSTSKLTEKQVSRLYAIAKKAGYNAEDVKKHLYAKFKLDSLSDLDKEKYDIMCNGYNNKINN